MYRGGASHPLVELTLARVREFFREPEAIFWAFVFPLVLTLALAAAFPSAADRPVVVGLLPGADTAAVRHTLETTPGLRVQQLTPAEERRALLRGPARRESPARLQHRHLCLERHAEGVATLRVRAVRQGGRVARRR